MFTVTKLADELLDLIAEEDPVNDAMTGYPGYQDRLADLDEQAQQRLRAGALGIAEAARGLGPAAEDRVTQALIAQQAEAMVCRIDARQVEHTMANYDISPIGRLLVALPLVAPVGDEQERNFLARLAAVPEFLAQAANRHRDGVRAGRLPVRDRAQRAIARLDDYLADPAADPLRAVPLSRRYADERDRLLDDLVRPAFAGYRRVLAEEVEPFGRPADRPGLCWLPDGAATYAALARTHTTTDHTPQELHRTGLELVERLAEEYRETGGRVFGAGTAAGEVRERMRTDPALRWADADEVLTVARATIERAERVAPDWFGRLPSYPCVLEPVPEADAASAPAGYYLPAALDGSRPGRYAVNTHLATRQHRYLGEALAFHEAVPGHHVQLSLAQELTDLPLLRRLAWINSYIEGWGLYAERLADEMGLYSGDLARLGMLAMDSMRAARLVVDTGLHAFGWSRERAAGYLREQTVMADADIQREVDRYVEMPGQALSYMVGRLEIQRLRARAEAELGSAFDVRSFHDLVLGGGPLPMGVLDEVIAEWTVTAAARATRDR